MDEAVIAKEIRTKTSGTILIFNNLPNYRDSIFNAQLVRSSLLIEHLKLSIEHFTLDEAVIAKEIRTKTSGTILIFNNLPNYRDSIFNAQLVRSSLLIEHLKLSIEHFTLDEAGIVKGNPNKNQRHDFNFQRAMLNFQYSAYCFSLFIEH